MKINIADNINIAIKLNNSITFEEMDNEGFFYNESNEKLIVANLTTLHIYKLIKNNIENKVSDLQFSLLFDSIKCNFIVNVNDFILAYDIIKTINDLLIQEIIIIKDNE